MVAPMIKVSAPVPFGIIVELRSRYRSQVCSRSGPAGPRTADKDLDLGYTLSLVCHSPPPIHQTFLRHKMTSNHYFMTSNHVPLTLAIWMTFRMTLRITLRMTLWMKLRMTFGKWELEL